MFAHAMGGTRYCVCAHLTLCSGPINMSGKFSVHVLGGGLRRKTCPAKNVIVQGGYGGFRFVCFVVNWIPIIFVS